jgi:hypothetical protein
VITNSLHSSTGCAGSYQRKAVRATGFHEDKPEKAMTWYRKFYIQLFYVTKRQFFRFAR